MVVKLMEHTSPDMGIIGNVTQDIVDEYLEYHRNPSNKDLGTMILE